MAEIRPVIGDGNGASFAAFACMPYASMRSMSSLV
jgi:hypothetical protein